MAHLCFDRFEQHVLRDYGGRLRQCDLAGQDFHGCQLRGAECELVSFIQCI